KWFTSVDNAVRNGATQCGKLVNFMRHCIGLEDSQIIKLLTNHLEDYEIPDRLNLPAVDDTPQSGGIKLQCLRLIDPDSHDIYSLA
ncbi:hypothetical protein, partial [Photobacterium rosenbergii]|uniref:hypothetical protein n=1 Tax=Photobacterium rosenbergii TaxID=294936 RepID=UPI001C995528